MRTKSTFLTLLIVAASLFVACTRTPEDSQSQGSNSVTGAFGLSQVAASTTSVTISWPANTGNSNYYTIYVFKDSTSDLYHSYEYVGYEKENHRFTVPFLNPNPDTNSEQTHSYYIVVKDSNGVASSVLHAELAENNVAIRNVLTQNFDQLSWGYDYVNYASGVRLNKDDEDKLDSYTPDTIADSQEDCHTVNKPDEEGGLLFRCSSSLKKLIGIEGWDSSSKMSVYIRPGYVKLGKASLAGMLKSPKFKYDEATRAGIKDNETVKVDLSFDVCMYCVNKDEANGKVVASIVKGDGTRLWSKEVNLDALRTTPKWQHYEFTAINNVTSDCHFEISSNEQTKQICFDNLRIVRHIDIDATHIYGYIIDKTTNEPIKGVAVSDGFQVVQTDEFGFYSMEPNEDSWYIFYTTPSEYKITVGGNGLPKFFTRRTANTREYSFSLRKLEGGAEEKFALFTLADPQVSSNTKLSRFKNEAVPAIKQHVQSMNCNCYGITLGDIISNSSGSNTEAFRDEMRYAMQYKYIGLPVFQVMGNHDANYYDEVVPVESDATSSTYNLRAQRLFENTYGPINYSFNRGNVHIIGMRDIVYNSKTSMANYTGGFLDSQYEWLKQDLALVPKTMTVVLCVHIPLHNYRIISAVNHIGEVHQLLNEFQEAHVISGHTHYNLNKEPSSAFPKVYEHNVGTVCGTWWASNLCGDGTPNGYGVFIGEGDGFSEWYYMGYNEGMNDRKYQMRLYRGNAITGAKTDDNKNGVEGYYAFNFGEDVILANVFNADSKWKIEVYEDGEYSGEMKKISDTSATYKSELVGTYSFEDPRRIKSGVEAANDMWVVGFHMGVLDRYTKDKAKDEDAEGDEEVVTSGKPSNGSWTANTHMYKYKLKNKDAKVKVVAIDRFGNRYESDKFVDYRDNDLARKP